MKLRSLFLGLFAIASCGGDSSGDKCKDACTASCPGEVAPTAADITNCNTECDGIQARAEKSGCDDELGKLYDCSAKHMCSATFASDCNTQGTDVNQCFTVYCRSHTSDPDC
jgi:hypothetical protein